MCILWKKKKKKKKVEPENSRVFHTHTCSCKAKHTFGRQGRNCVITNYISSTDKIQQDNRSFVSRDGCGRSKLPMFRVHEFYPRVFVASFVTKVVCRNSYLENSASIKNFDDMTTRSVLRSCG